MKTLHNIHPWFSFYLINLVTQNFCPKNVLPWWHKLLYLKYILSVIVAIIMQWYKVSCSSFQNMSLNKFIHLSVNITNWIKKIKLKYFLCYYLHHIYTIYSKICIKIQEQKAWSSFCLSFNCLFQFEENK